MKWYLLLLLGILSSNLCAQDIPCPTPNDIAESSLSLEDMRELCTAVVQNDPNCKSVKDELKFNCAEPQQNKLISNDLLLEKIGGCLKGLFFDSIVDLGNLIVEMISTLVDVNIKTAKGMYQFFSDEKYRSELISKFQNSSSDTGKLLSSFFRMSAAYFSQNFSRNLKDSYYNPMVAIPKTFFEPFVKFLTDTVQGMAEQYVGEFNCMNGPAKANSICKMIGDILVPPTAFFAYLKGSKAGILMMKNLKKGKGVIGSIRNTHNTLNILKVSKNLKPAERIAESTRVLSLESKEFKMTQEKADALLEAHNVGLVRGYFKYTPEDIEKKRDILLNAGFTRAERRILMDRGLVGGAGQTDILEAAKEAALKAAALAIEVTKLSQKSGSLTPPETLVFKKFEEELKVAAQRYQEAALATKNPTTLSKSWLASLRAGDVETSFKTAEKGIKEMNMSPMGIQRNLDEKLNTLLMKQKDFPTDPVVAMEIKSIKALKEKLAKAHPDIPQRMVASATAAPAKAPLTVSAPPEVRPTVQPTQVAPSSQVASKSVSAQAPSPKSAPTQAPSPKTASVPETASIPGASSTPIESVKHASESMTPKQAIDEGHKLRLKGNREEASKYFLRAAQKRTLEDRNFSLAIDESMRGEGTIVLDIIKNGKNEQKLLNELINVFHEEQLHLSKSDVVKRNLKKIVEALDNNPEVRSLLYNYQLRDLDQFRNYTRNLGQ